MIDGHGDDLYKYSAIRLNFSSNIPSYADLSALEEHLSRRLSVIRSYPEPAPRSLEAKIAHFIGKNPDEVLVTNGATEAIYLIAQTFQNEGTYAVLRPTFSEYDSACQMFGLSEAEDAALYWICNPNNPTGEVFGETQIRALARHHRLLVVDQSYEDYTSAVLPHVDDLPNVVVLHSMTKKCCIPGLRLGYLTAPRPIVEKLRLHCRPWSVNALAIEAGMWLLSQPLPDNRALLREAQRLHAMLNALPGLHVRETQTNFMLCTIDASDAACLKEYLAFRHGLLIRDAANFRGLTPHHFRVAAQRPADNNELVEAIKMFIDAL